DPSRLHQLRRLAVLHPHDPRHLSLAPDAPERAAAVQSFRLPGHPGPVHRGGRGARRHPRVVPADDDVAGFGTRITRRSGVLYLEWPPARRTHPATLTPPRRRP